MNSRWICTTLVFAAYLSCQAVYAQSFYDAPAATSGAPAAADDAPAANSGQSSMPTTLSSDSSAPKTFVQTNEIKSGAAGAANGVAGKHSTFNADDYLSGGGSAFQNSEHGMNTRPNFGSGAPKETDLAIGGTAGKLDYKAPYATNSFASSINQADKMNDLKPFVQMKKPINTSPAWAREKSQTTHTFQDNQEHFGSEDPYGFSSQ